jgi:hypothetical protein
MKTWIKVALVSALFAVPAMALGQLIWPPHPGNPEPSGGQLPFFILLSVFEAVAFGLGISFLLFGFHPLLRLVRGSRLRAWAMYLSVGWFLVSWWPHDNLHLHIGFDLQGLLYIEYGFHVTLIIAALVLAFSLLTMLKPGEAGVETGGGEVRVR